MTKHTTLAVAAAAVVAATAAAAPAHAATTKAPPKIDSAVIAEGVLGPVFRERFGTRFGCIAEDAPRHVVLLVTAARDVAPANKIIAKAKAKRFMSVGVIDPRLSQPAITAIRDAIVLAAGADNPDVLVSGGPSPTTASCGHIGVILSSGAPDWVKSAVTSRAAAAGTDRLTLTVVAPDQMPPRPIPTL